MNPWKCRNYEKFYDDLVRKGISLHFEGGIDPDFRRLVMDFTRWLRKNFVFPIHVNVYIKNCEKVKLLNGQMAFGAFRWFGIYDEPYIRLPAKPDTGTMLKYPAQEVHETILSSLIHELTHYFQWVNQMTQIDRVSEWQANYYRYRLIEAYERDTACRETLCNQTGPADKNSAGLLICKKGKGFTDWIPKTTLTVQGGEYKSEEKVS